MEEKWFCSKMTSALALNFDDPWCGLGKILHNRPFRDHSDFTTGSALDSCPDLSSRAFEMKNLLYMLASSGSPS